MQNGCHGGRINLPPMGSWIGGLAVQGEVPIDPQEPRLQVQTYPNRQAKGNLNQQVGSKKRNTESETRVCSLASLFHHDQSHPLSGGFKGTTESISGL